eukprot:scaffold27544_cov78-Skeletonema_dohrnii-CCMP3373.AAC.5
MQEARTKHKEMSFVPATTEQDQKIQNPEPQPDPPFIVPTHHNHRARIIIINSKQLASVSGSS